MEMLRRVILAAQDLQHCRGRAKLQAQLRFYATPQRNPQLNIFYSLLPDVLVEIVQSILSIPLDSITLHAVLVDKLFCVGHR